MMWWAMVRWHQTNFKWVSWIEFWLVPLNDILKFILGMANHANPKMFRFEKNVSTAPLSNSDGFWPCCNETRCLIKLCHKHSGAKTSVPVFSCEVVTGPQALESSHQTCASKLQSQQLETLQSEMVQWYYCRWVSRFCPINWIFEDCRAPIDFGSN